MSRRRTAPTCSRPTGSSTRPAPQRHPRGDGPRDPRRAGADRWCITDVRFHEPFAAERWTWVDAPFNEGRAVWQHLMADGVWRIDYQMDEDADPETISRPEVAGARLRAQLGAGASRSSWSGSARGVTATICSRRFRVGRGLHRRRRARRLARSARAAATAASRTRTTSAGSSPPCSQGKAPERAARQLPRRAPRRRRREPARRPAAAPASSPRARRSSVACAAPTSPWRARTSSRAGSSTRGGWRRPTPIRRRRGRATARARCRTSPLARRR